MDIQYISVIVPAYNEEENILRTIENILDFFKVNHFTDAEVIIIDDGSVDKTGKICDEVSEIYQQVRVHHNDKQQGYTEALRAGFEMKSGDVMIVLDADLQSNIEDSRNMLSQIGKGYDIVVGWRKNRKESLTRRTISKVYNLLVNLLFDIQLHDVNGKPKVIRSSVLEEVELNSSGWVFDLELAIKAKKLGFKLTEVPIQHYPRKRGKSKLSLKSILETFIGILALKWHGY